MPDYDHTKNLAEARLREERRELVICAVGLALMAAVIFTLACRACGSHAAGLLGVLACVFALGAVWFGAQAIWFIDREDGR
jgi:hypothetical protein